MKPMLAWIIPEESSAQIIAAIKFYHLNKPTALTPEIVRHLLIDRIQGQINEAENPDEEARLLEEGLMELGLHWGTCKRQRWQLTN